MLAEVSSRATELPLVIVKIKACVMSDAWLAFWFKDDTLILKGRRVLPVLQRLT